MVGDAGGERGCTGVLFSQVQVRWRLWREAPAAYIARQELL